ncbi:hypothetical protein BGZ96_001389, partial [Linnemannia gamsii]
ADTDTLREAHEHQRRMQQRLQEQQSSVPESPVLAKKTGLSMLKPAATGAATTGLVKSRPIARSTSASALPPSTMMSLNAGSTSAVTGYSTPGSTGGSVGTDTGYSSPYFAGSAASSPFLTAIDHHHHHNTHSSGPAQLRSTTHSPALFSKFYDVEHRLPWLSLPGTVGSPALSANGGGGGAEGPTSMFVRRRSDVGLPSSGRSTPSGHDLGSSSLSALQSHQDGSQQEASSPQPPQPQPQAHSHHHHHHAQHLLGPQELAALSRHNSPMPLNEALPHYLRKKSVDSSHSMERSFSSPGTNSFHPPPHTGSHFILPLGGSSTTTNSGVLSNGGSVGQSPSHQLFSFPGSTSHPTTTASSNRPEMERASSAGVLPMMHRPTPQPQKQTHSHSGTTNNSGPGSTSIASSGGITAPSTLATGTAGSAAASFFRTLTPGVNQPHHHHHGVGFGSITGLDASSSPSGTTTPSKLFGHHVNSSDRDLPSNKEVHA